MRWQTARDVMLFFGGLAGLAHETVVATSERPTLILAFLAMMGVVPVLRAIEQQSKGNSHEK